MLVYRSQIAILCAATLLAPAGGFAADAPAPQQAATTKPFEEQPTGFLGRIERPYRARKIAPISTANSGRIEQLLRAGNLYLSLQDTIALALENNLDIAIQRYNPLIADVVVMQAEAGGFARGVSTNVTAGPSSATVNAAGTTPGANQNAASQASTATLSAVGGSVLQSSGPNIPNLDPVLTGGASWAHQTNPQSNTFLTGTTSLISRQKASNFGIQKGFITGTNIALGLNNNSATSNNPRNDINPLTQSSLSLQITQRLLQGFGPSINSRQIHIARNNREVSDLTFKAQVETTVAAISSLYWSLVALNEQVKVAQEAVSAAQRLFEDNRRQVEVGTMAPIEVTRAEAQIAAGEQQLTLARMQVLQQETILKTALSRTGVASPSLQDAHVIPTDVIRVPDVEPVQPIQDMTALAISSRPELAQSRIQIQNQNLTIKGSRNALLPSLDAFVTTSNSALAGDPTTFAAPPGSIRNNNPFFIGGYGTVLGQLFSRNFPNYAAGVSLNIPLRNRQAQAQAINDELTLRQQQLGLQRLENQVRVDVQNAVIGLTQARAQYLSATKQRTLMAATLDAEQKKLALGASTIYNVIQDQQALTAAESNEVTARANYARARVELDRATGQILVSNNISLDEAFRGVVSRPPSALPPLANSPAPAPRQ
jgi:outer membrane protein